MRKFVILLVQTIVTLCVALVWAYCSIEAKKPLDLDPMILGVVVIAWGLEWPGTLRTPKV